jgi:hypothetical protein
MSLPLLNSSNNLWPLRNQLINYIRRRSGVNKLIFLSVAHGPQLIEHQQCKG